MDDIETNLLVAARNASLAELRVWGRSSKEVVGENPVNSVNRLGESLLHLAAYRGNAHAISYLLGERMVDIETPTNYGRTALHYACSSKNQLIIVHYLVEVRGANLEARDVRGNTPLHTASNCGCKDIVEYLVEDLQANVDATNDDDETPLDRALKNRREDVSRYLLPKASFVFKSGLNSWVWTNDNLADIRGMVLEKYASGQGLSDAYTRKPIHTILASFPLPTIESFRVAIELFPPSALSLLDEDGRLSIHVAAATTRRQEACGPSIISFLLDREPRLALARDPMTGLFPHETVALLSYNYYTPDTSLLDIVYKLFRSNPQHLLQHRRVPVLG